MLTYPKRDDAARLLHRLKVERRHRQWHCLTRSSEQPHTCILQSQTRNGNGAFPLHGAWGKQIDRASRSMQARGIPHLPSLWAGKLRINGRNSRACIHTCKFRKFRVCSTGTRRCGLGNDFVGCRRRPLEGPHPCAGAARQATHLFPRCKHHVLIAPAPCAALCAWRPGAGKRGLSR